VIKAPAGACARDSAATGGCAEIGQEIEVYNLLIIDQHSFAGTYPVIFTICNYYHLMSPITD